MFLNQQGSGVASDNQLQRWSYGTVMCPAGKSIFGGSFSLRRADGLRLSNAEWASLTFWGTVTTNVNAQGFGTSGPGTGTFTVIYLNPTQIALAADTDYICATVAP
jgi:hypothetical protein